MPLEPIPGRLTSLSLSKLAWRNLARNRRRTWITATTVALAVLLLNISMSLLIGIEQQSMDNLINYQTGHAKIFAEGYFEAREELPLEFMLTGLPELHAKIGAVPGVAASTPRLNFSAQLSNGVDQIGCFGVGIDLSGSDTDVFLMPQAVIEGTYLDPAEDGMLLGGGLAELFGASVGDWLTVLTKTRAGAYEAIDMPVVGLLGTGNPQIDRASFLIPMETARFVLDVGEEATELAVRFAPSVSESKTIRNLQSSLAGGDGIEVRGWRDIEADFLALARMKRTGQVVFLGIFVLLAVVGVTNTTLMAAFERTREIGMLMAMGLRNSGIRKLFLTEGALVGLMGGLIGIAIALPLIGWFAVRGLDLTAMYGDIDIGYPVKDMMFPALSVVTLSLTWILTGMLAALASLYPAVRASRKKPVEALRHV
jgi:ABC-type lipoprotein release transport system permease subunit